MTIHEYDVVALTEDFPGTHPETNAAIMLRRGQVGTVLMAFVEQAFLVDFADNDGHTYAMATIAAHQLMPLLYKPVETAA